MSFMHFAQTDKGKAEAGQRKVRGAVGTGRAGELSNFLRGRASRNRGYQVLALIEAKHTFLNELLL